MYNVDILLMGEIVASAGSLTMCFWCLIKALLND
jgi:hypothetical protein